MTDRDRPQTLSRALLSLSRINSAEGAIHFGLEGFYKARKFNKIQPGEKEEAKLNLKRFEEFCKGFTVIVKSQQKGNVEFKKFQKQWINEKTEGELTSHIEILLSTRSLYSVLQSKNEVQKWLEKFEKLEKVAEKTRKEDVDPEKVDDALESLRDLHLDFTRAFDREKKASEKILSGRALFT